MTKKPLDPKLAEILDSIRATVGGAGPPLQGTGGAGPPLQGTGGAGPPPPGADAEPAPEGASARADATERAVPAPLPEPRAAVRSVEEFLADLIRPQVQAWLDQNLPELVQQMTADEIAKMIDRK